MKKTCIGLLILIFALSLVSVAAAQEEEAKSTSLLKLENFSQKGSIRARWYNVNNSHDFNDDNNDNDNWFDQRLRLQGKYEPVKNYSLNYRIDVGEGVWGTDYAGGISNRPSEDVEFQFDQLYMRLDPGPVTISIGQHMCIWGNMWVFQPRATGATMRVKVLDPFLVDLHWGKRSEGGSNYDRDGNEDEDLYGAQLMYKTKKFWLSAYYAGLSDKAGTSTSTTILLDDQGTASDLDDDTQTIVRQRDDDDLRQAIGFAGNGTIGPLQLSGELTFFSGENKNTDVDYVGTQLVAEGIYKLKAARIGARFYYAEASDDDEAQLTVIQMADPHASFLWGIGEDMERDLPEFTGVGRQTKSSPASFYYSIFDPSHQGAGVVGGALYADYQVTEKMLLSAGITYVTPQDDDKTDLDGNPVYLDSLTVYNLGMKYNFLTQLYMVAGMTYWVPEFDDDADIEEDAMFGFTSQIYLLF
jgi:hypothetical protein